VVTVPAAEVPAARRQIQFAHTAVAVPTADNQRADEPPAQAPEARPGRRQLDGGVERIVFLGLCPREGIREVHDGPGRVEGIDLVADAVLPAAVVDPAPAPCQANAGPQDALAHPAVGIDVLAVLDGGFLGPPPPVVEVAAP